MESNKQGGPGEEAGHHLACGRLQEQMVVQFRIDGARRVVERVLENGGGGECRSVHKCNAGGV